MNRSTRLHKDAEPIRATRAPAGLLQRKCACGGALAVGKHCAECEKKEQELQRFAIEPAAAPAIAPPIVHQVLRSPGTPLSDAARAFMEPRFGRDLSNVRVHTGPLAAESARAVNAQAYTFGKEIVLRDGDGETHSHHDARILAHELAHAVANQPIPLPTDELLVAPAMSAQEAAADATSTRIVGEDGGGAVSGLRESSHIQRLADDRTSAAPNSVKPAVAARAPAGTVGKQAAALPQTVKFWLAAFIPSNAPNAFTLQKGDYAGRQAFRPPPPKIPNHGNSCFETDAREFVPQSKEARVWIEGTLDVKSAQFSFTHGSAPVFEVDCDSGQTLCEDKPKVPVQTRQANTVGGAAAVYISASGANPCVSIAPNLSITGIVNVDPHARTISFVGSSTLFPSFEMYVSADGVTKPVFTNVPLINTPVALLLGAVRPILAVASF